MASLSPSEPVAPVAGTGILATTKAGPLPPQATCAPGSDPDLSGPADQERPIRSFAWDLALAFDRRAGRVVFLDGRTPSETRALDTWTFDVCTNSWLRAHPDQAPSGGTDGAGVWLTYDADSDRTVALTYAGSRTEVWAYDLAADRWTRGSDAPWSQPGTLGLVYDPVSGLVVMRDAVTREMWAYEVERDRWTAVLQGPVLPRAMWTDGIADRQVLGYDASADRLVLYVEGEPAWTFDARAERWSQDDGNASLPPELWYAWFGSGTASAYDEAARRTLFVSAGGPVRLPGVVAYDASRHDWEGLWTGSPCLDSTVTYDAVNGRIVCLSSMSSETDDIWTAAPRGMAAFDAVARRWVTLLEPVTQSGRPAGSLPPQVAPTPAP
jgi:hypothetical protein